MVKGEEYRHCMYTGLSLRCRNSIFVLTACKCSNYMLPYLRISKKKPSIAIQKPRELVLPGVFYAVLERWLMPLAYCLISFSTVTCKILKDMIAYCLDIHSEPIQSYSKTPGNYASRGFLCRLGWVAYAPGLLPIFNLR